MKMTKIYKYELPQISNIVKMPKNSSYMKFAMQNDIPHMWAAVTDSEVMETWEIKFLMTGDEVRDEDGVYMNTLFCDNGIVLHVFGRKIL